MAEFRLEPFVRELPLADFRARYQDRARFLPYCRACPNYQTVWSCPPFSFDVDEYLAPFRRVRVVCMKIHLASALIEAADTPEKVKDTGWRIVVYVKKRIEARLRAEEQKTPGSRALSSGGCNLCANCTRTAGAPCRAPERMRYSLDALGFDLSAITEDLFGIRILWCRDRLPAYFTLIHALLLP